MNHVQLIELAAGQFNRFSRAQLYEIGIGASSIRHRIESGSMVRAGPDVFALAPLLEDDWGRWMGATLTRPGTFLSHLSAARAWGFWGRAETATSVTRVGRGGPRRVGGLRIFESRTLEGETTRLRGVPITLASRTLIDIAPTISERGRARCVREAVRLERTTVEGIADALGRNEGRRGCGFVAEVLASYAGLPIERARSGAEVKAMSILRDAGRPLPQLNQRVAGLEADLSWPRDNLIIEIDGRPFHLDVGEDAQRDATWRTAGWEVHRIPADDVLAGGTALLAAAPTR